MLCLERDKIVIGMMVQSAAKDAWRLLTDTQQWARWGPSVSDVACEHRYIGPDSKGRVKTLFGFWVPFTVTGFRDQQFWGWRIGRFPATGHRVRVEDETSCVVAFDMPWWALPYLIVCHIALGRIKRLLTSNGQNST